MIEKMFHQKKNRGHQKSKMVKIQAKLFTAIAIGPNIVH